MKNSVEYWKNSLKETIDSLKKHIDSEYMEDASTALILLAFNPENSEEYFQFVKDTNLYKTKKQNEEFLRKAFNVSNWMGLWFFQSMVNGLADDHNFHLIEDPKTGNKKLTFDEKNGKYASHEGIALAIGEILEKKHQLKITLKTWDKVILSFSIQSRSYHIFAL